MKPEADLLFAYGGTLVDLESGGGRGRSGVDVCRAGRAVEVNFRLDAGKKELGVAKVRFLLSVLDSRALDREATRPTNLSEAVRMVHKLMEQKSQARKEMEMEGNKRKWENFQSGNSSR
ncbi:hypothetical protein Tco_0519068, partial [Tanacetum coccineum]